MKEILQIITVNIKIKKKTKYNCIYEVITTINRIQKGKKIKKKLETMMKTTVLDESYFTVKLYAKIS